MTETTLCGYCVDLPENGRAAAAQVSRCPLCKADLGVTAAGQHFRIDSTSAPPRRGPVLALLALAGAAVCIASLVVWMALRPGPTVHVVMLPPPPVPIAEATPVDEPQPVTAPADSAVVKRYAEGVLSPEARVKPQIGPLVPVPSRAEVVIEPMAPKIETELPAAATKRIGQVHTAFLRQLPDLSALDATQLKVAWDLMMVPEVTLEQPLIDSSPEQVERAYQEDVKKWLVELAQKIAAKNEKEPDGFIHVLMQERHDLAGLPFRLGKSCQLPAERAVELGCASSAIRDALDDQERQLKKTGKTPSGGAASPSSAFDPADSLWYEVGLGRSGPSARKPNERAAASVLPALMQILASERGDLRSELVAHYRQYKGPLVTSALARLAVYDPEPKVRADALLAVRDRPANESADLLLEALQYPWPPVAQRAADAVVQLQREDLLPRLVELLARPDPAAPFEQEFRGKKMTVLRELVKINHNRNCLLCHAPGNRFSAKNRLPVGVVPSPAEKLPPSRGAVYAERNGSVVVRVDVTYLRQDFSLMLAVDHAFPWPEVQRFDFLVRTRELTDSEARVLQQQTAPPPPSPQRQALLSALRRLTGLNAGPSAAAWQQALSDSRAWPASPGRVDCRK